MIKLRFLIDFASSKKNEYDVRDFLFKRINKQEKGYIELVPLSGDECNLPKGEFNEKIKVWVLDPTGVEIDVNYFNKIEVFNDKIKLYE